MRSVIVKNIGIFDMQFVSGSLIPTEPQSCHGAILKVVRHAVCIGGLPLYAPSANVNSQATTISTWLLGMIVRSSATYTHNLDIEADDYKDVHSR